MGDIIGPALPPHLQNTNCSVTNEDENDKSVSKQLTAESNSQIGPALPPWLAKRATAAEEDQSFGPSLPPELQTASLNRPGVALQGDCSQKDDYDDDPIIGPQPSTSDDNSTTLADDIEERSKKMKNRLLGLDQPKKLEREEWMTELPPLLQGFGGGPRKFRAHAREIGDRSVWTDTPSDKAKRNCGGTSNSKTDQDRIEKEAQSKRDKEIQHMLSQTKDGARNESLMSLHEKERKRKAEAAEASGEAKLRRPFDRDLDLQANKFDEAAKKRFMKKSEGLSSRFSSSTTSKFL